MKSKKRRAIFLINKETKYKGGIYKISNMKNGRFYLGSAKSFICRWTAHISELRNDKHCNSFLQNDFNKCGENVFKFEIIEIIEGCELDRKNKEQDYLNEVFNNIKYDGLIYNSAKTAVVSTPPPSKKEHTYRKNCYWLLSPDNIEYLIEDLDEFCKKFNLNHRKVIELHNQKIPYYNNWKFQKPENRFSVIINKNTNEEVETKGKSVSELGRKLNIEITHLRKVITGNRKSCGDWIVKNRIIITKPWKGKTWKIVSFITGEIVVFNNLDRFARENNLSKSKLRSLVNEKSNILYSKGWIKYGYTMDDVLKMRKQSYVERTKKRQRNHKTGKFLSKNKS